MINISQPVLEYRGTTVRLSAEIGRNDQTKELWYEMPASISPYLNKDDATPFLVALLPQAAYLGEDLVVDAAISQRIFYSIENNLSLSKKPHCSKAIGLHAGEETEKKEVHPLVDGEFL